MVGAGAKVLGNIHIGDFARIGAGSIVLQNVPAHCTAVGIPARNICRSKDHSAPLEKGNTHNPEAITQQLLQRIEQLENEVEKLKGQSSSNLKIDAGTRGRGDAEKLIELTHSSIMVR